MNVYIHHIETAVPETCYDQKFAREKMEGWVQDRRARRMVHHVYRKSGIDRRYSVLKDFLPGTQAELFPLGEDGRPVEAGTGARNRIFSRESKRMSVELAGRLLTSAQGFEAGDVTHVITVSCTGFYNPGPDYHVVRELGLSDATQRFHLGFMGCYAAFPALRMARQFCEANPRAVVLIVCLELCSLHMQIKDDLDSLLANALFSDGAAAALVSGREPMAGNRALLLGSFLSSLAPSGEKEMAWDIGDTGFNIVLSAYVPEIISANIRGLLDPVLAMAGLDLADIDHWAVHPGGKAIIDKVGKALGLEDWQLDRSRAVLRDYGNMSSATVLFVLKEMLQSTSRVAPGKICAMAFGPGLTIETGLLELVKAARSSRAIGKRTAEGTP